MALTMCLIETRAKSALTVQRMTSSEDRHCHRRRQERVDADSRIVVAAERRQSAHLRGLLERHCERNQRAHRVTDDCGAVDVQARKRRMEQLTLSRRRPHPVSRSVAVAERRDDRTR